MIRSSKPSPLTSPAFETERPEASSASIPSSRKPFVPSSAPKSIGCGAASSVRSSSDSAEADNCCWSAAQLAEERLRLLRSRRFADGPTLLSIAPNQGHRCENNSMPNAVSGQIDTATDENVYSLQGTLNWRECPAAASRTPSVAVNVPAIFDDVTEVRITPDSTRLTSTLDAGTIISGMSALAGLTKLCFRFFSNGLCGNIHLQLDHLPA
jgi:hypothetical protein